MANNELRSELPDGTAIRTRESPEHDGTVYKTIERDGQVTLGFIPRVGE